MYFVVAMSLIVCIIQKVNYLTSYFLTRIYGGFMTLQDKIDYLKWRIAIETKELKELLEQQTREAKNG